MAIFRNILGQSWTLKFHKVKLMKSKTFNFDLKYFWKCQLFHYENCLRFRKSHQLPGAGRTRAGHHHGSDMSTSTRAIYVLKSAKCNEIMPSVYLLNDNECCCTLLGVQLFYIFFVDFSNHLVYWVDIIHS